MAELTTIARPYAEATFRWAEQGNGIDRWSALLARMAQLVRDPALRGVIGDPKLGAAQLSEVFLGLSGEEAPAEAKNFVDLLVENDRLGLLPEIHELFQQRKNERAGVLEAEIFTAFPMEDGQLSAIVAQLETKFRRKINPRVQLDRELIGGVRIVVGDSVIDSSVRGKLANMRAALTA